MNKRESDIQIWEEIKTVYQQDRENGWDSDLSDNRLRAYYCPPESAKDHLILRRSPKQRIFARFLKSYLNTTWHKIHGGVEADVDPLFSELLLIERFREFTFKKKQEDFHEFVKQVLSIVEKLDLVVCSSDQEQKENFTILQKVINAIFTEFSSRKEQKNIPKNRRVSEYEKIIYETLADPYQTIMKMQKLLPGLGIALTCDFLKESHLCNIAKPDVHICHVFSVIDRVPYSMDLALVKRVAEFADNVCPPVVDHFCESGAYCVDKIIWMICSKGKKKELLKTLVKVTQ